MAWYVKWKKARYRTYIFTEKNTKMLTNNGFPLDGIKLWITFCSFFFKQSTMKLTYLNNQKIKINIILIFTAICS